MHTATEFLLRHGYVVLTVWVFVEQVGLPIPSMPVLLAAGALAGVGRMSLPTSLLCSVVAALIADSLWFQLGRLWGVQVLQLLCRISLEPDSCVRRTEDVFVRREARTLLVSKFLPGVNTVAPPLAGVVHMKPWRFLLFDALGAILWAGTFLGWATRSAERSSGSPRVRKPLADWQWWCSASDSRATSRTNSSSDGGFYVS